MTSKGTGTDAVGQPNQECCMCGDCGFSDQLFQCKVCRFRFQHRYCSNLYPKAKSYRTCNMCLSQKEDFIEKSPNSPNSSSSYKNTGSASDESKSKKIRKNGNSAQNIEFVGKKGLRASALKLQLDKPIKKQRSLEASSPSPSPSPSSVLVSTRERIVNKDASEERLRRTKSEEDITNRTGVTKQVLRNKVRRYKLLDEVLS